MLPVLTILCCLKPLMATWLSHREYCSHSLFNEADFDLKSHVIPFKSALSFPFPIRTAHLFIPSPNDSLSTCPQFSKSGAQYQHFSGSDWIIFGLLHLHRVPLSSRLHKWALSEFHPVRLDASCSCTRRTRSRVTRLQIMSAKSSRTRAPGSYR